MVEERMQPGPEVPLVTTAVLLVRTLERHQIGAGAFHPRSYFQVCLETKRTIRKAFLYYRF
jgi:hypothetical protein